ncbi:hypothetical protein GCM10010344_43220 [Streptomyces bluensis]|nr:hypothetical protein GCM10010344_43220 [Streptomyces bluensis]
MEKGPLRQGVGDAAGAALDGVEADAEAAGDANADDDADAVGDASTEGDADTEGDAGDPPSAWAGVVVSNAAPIAERAAAADNVRGSFIVGPCGVRGRRAGRLCLMRGTRDAL